MIGIPEIIVIVIVLVIIIAEFYVPLFCKKHYPNKLWLGIVLCLFSPAGGQFYLTGGLKYIVILGLLYSVFKTFKIQYAFLICDLLSVGIMYWRFLKNRHS